MKKKKERREKRNECPLREGIKTGELCDRISGIDDGMKCIQIGMYTSGYLFFLYF